MNKMETFVINPDTHKPVSVAEWAKEKKPKRAELLLLKTEGYSLLIAKKMFDGEYDFDKAQEKAAEYKPKGLESLTFRCPTRKECVDIYDARFIAGLDEALKLVGGDAMSETIWTCERGVDPWFARRYHATNAWSFYQHNGALNSNDVYYAYRCRACTLLTL